jgi:hypothetical protein
MQMTRPTVYVIDVNLFSRCVKMARRIVRGWDESRYQPQGAAVICHFRGFAWLSWPKELRTH